ncbi:MAG: hypothetical protein A2340_02075 [Lentisphaerae bacterium RIFOXYB12_FULL_60_10]|nr:MAG: hypothetical protein A2340_02075 [Lentisphaerae bacterium RIFOXYB12_FULL_60_10]
MQETATGSARSKRWTGGLPVVLLSVLALEAAVIISRLFPGWDDAATDLRLRWRAAFARGMSAPHGDLTLVEIDDTTMRTFGRWGAGRWISRRPFLDQLIFLERHLKPTVLAFDVVFQDTTGAFWAEQKRVSESESDMDHLVRQMTRIRSDPQQLVELGTLDRLNRFTIEQGNAMLSIQCASLADQTDTELIFGYFFRGGVATASGARPEDWSPEDVHGDDPGGDESAGYRIPYLLDLAIPEGDVHFPDPEARAAYRYAMNATLPGRDLLDYAMLGALNGLPDPDGVVRRLPMVIGFSYENRILRQTRTHFVPTFSLAAILMHGGVKFPLKPGDVEVWMGDRIRVRSPRLGNLDVPIDPEGRLLLNYEHLLEDFRRVSFAEVAPPAANRQLMERRATRLRAAFDNRLAVVAVTGTGLDVGATPLGSPVPLVLAHLTALDNLLRQRYLIPLTPFQDGLVTGLVVLLFTLICLIERSSRLGLLALGFGLCYLLLAFKGVYWNGWILPVVTPVVHIVIASFLVTSYRFFTEERARRRIRGIFSTMVSGKVLTYLEERPESFSLTGHAAEVTAFFSDIEGFTTISESLSPERLTRFLNTYLTPVTDCILESGGYLDKYMGDGIMAVWGAPYRDPEHAVKACRAALEQQTLIDRMNAALVRDYGTGIRVRMGINSGVATAGNMGSERRFQYTVVGDTVNLAARLEPVNKEFGTRILIGDDTCRQVGNHLITRPLIRIRVKGKQQLVLIHELVGDPGTVDERQRLRFKQYADALERYSSQAFPEAIRILEALLADGDDGPGRCLLTMAREYVRNPPGPDWRGEYIRQAKD